LGLTGKLRIAHEGLNGTLVRSPPLYALHTPPPHTPLLVERVCREGRRRTWRPISTRWALIPCLSLQTSSGSTARAALTLLVRVRWCVRVRVRVRVVTVLTHRSLHALWHVNR
jgi:hypothetical protein